MFGYSRARNFANTGVLVKDQANTYAVPATLQLNQWGLSGVWTIEGERAILDSAPGRIVFQFPRSGPAPGAGPDRRWQTPCVFGCCSMARRLAITTGSTSMPRGREP